MIAKFGLALVLLSNSMVLAQAPSEKCQLDSLTCVADCLEDKATFTQLQSCSKTLLRCSQTFKEFRTEAGERVSYGELRGTITDLELDRVLQFLYRHKEIQKFVEEDKTGAR